MYWLSTTIQRYGLIAEISVMVTKFTLHTCIQLAINENSLSICPNSICEFEPIFSRHHFCLKCINTMVTEGGELNCLHCWKRTELPAPDMKSDNLPTNMAVLYLTQNMSLLNMKPKAPDKKNGAPITQSQQQQQQHQQHQQQQQQQLSPPSNSLPSATNNVIRKSENCHTHAMPNSLWCVKCHTTICRACAGGDEHRSHNVKTHSEAKDAIRSDIGNELSSMHKSLGDVQLLVLRQRDFLLKILEASTSLKTQIETELINHMPTLEMAEMRESLGKAKLCLNMLDQQSLDDAFKLYSTIHLEKQRLQNKQQELFLQCKLDDIIRQYGSLFDFDLIKQALVGLQANGGEMNAFNSNGAGHNNSVLLLANYCVSQLYSRHVLTTKHVQMMNNGGNGGNGGGGVGANGNGSNGASTSNGNYSVSPQLLHNSTIQEHKTFAEIAGSPKPVQVNSFSNHLPDAIGSHPSPNQQNSSHGNGTLRHAPSSYMSDMNGSMGVPMTMIQHLQ